MREGVNPEKYKSEKNIKKAHRVLVVFHIPNTNDEYYKESNQVLDYCLNSLVKTINFETTNITLINNNSHHNTELLVKGYIEKGFIDKYVSYNENKGKVYAVINEVRGVFEPFVTIADCDVLFFKGWEKAVFEIFNNFPKAGVVSPLPMPNAAFLSNAALFFDNIFFNKIKYDKMVADEDVELYLKGVNNKALINRNAKFNWKEKQYFLRGKIIAIVGATHFIATYRSDIFRDQYTFPLMKFVNGYETEFIDALAERKGLYRLSTVKTYAYHIGNKLDDFTRDYLFESVELVNSKLLKNLVKSKRNINIIPFTLKKNIIKVLDKIKRI